MADSKVDIYKIHAKNIHIFEIKAILRDVFFKYLHKQDIEQFLSVHSGHKQAK